MRFYLYSYMTAVLLFFVVQGETWLPGTDLPVLPAHVADGHVSRQLTCRQHRHVGSVRHGCMITCCVHVLRW